MHLPRSSILSSLRPPKFSTSIPSVVVSATWHVLGQALATSLNSAVKVPTLSFGIAVVTESDWGLQVASGGSGVVIVRGSG